MNKKEFIDKLRVALNGRIPVSAVEETVRYYEDYINTEIRKGKSEAEVLNVLGDPRLIAKTIVQTNGGAQNGKPEDYGYRSSQSGQENYPQQSGNSKVYGMPKWLFLILVFLVLLVILSVVFSVLSFLAPIIIVMAAVLFLVKLFRDWLN